MDKNKEAVEILKDIKDAKDDIKSKEFLSAMVGYLKDIRGFTQDNLLEELIHTENEDKMSKVILDIQDDISFGFKDLSKQISKLGLFSGKKEDVIVNVAKPSGAYNELMALNAEDQIEYLSNLNSNTSDILTLLRGANNLKSVGAVTTNSKSNKSKGKEGFFEKIAGGIVGFLGRIANSNVPATVEKSSGSNSDLMLVNAQDQVYYLSNLNSSTDEMLAIMRNESKPVPSSTGASSVSSAVITKKEDNNKGFFGGIADSILEFLGLTSLTRYAKSYIEPIFAWLFKPVKLFGTMLMDFASKQFTKIMTAIFNSKPMIYLIEKLFTTKIGAFFLNLFSKLSPFVKGFSKFIPIIGQIVMIITSVIDAVSAFGKMEEISGKVKSTMTLLEKISVGLAGIISLGIFDAKKIYKVIMSINKLVEDIYNSFMAAFPKSVKAGLESVMSGLFNKDKGLFGFILRGIEEIINDLSDGKFLKALWKALLYLPKVVIDSIGNILDTMFKKSFGKDAKDLIVTPIVNMFTTLIQAVMDAMSSMLRQVPMIGNSMADAIDKLRAGTQKPNAIVGNTNDVNYANKPTTMSNIQPSQPSAMPANLKMGNTTDLMIKASPKQKITVNQPPISVNVTPAQTKPIAIPQRSAGSELMFSIERLTARPAS